MIVQDEGEDVVIENLDFSSVGNKRKIQNVNNCMNMDQEPTQNKFLIQIMIHHIQ